MAKQPTPEQTFVALRERTDVLQGQVASARAAAAEAVEELAAGDPAKFQELLDTYGKKVAAAAALEQAAALCAGRRDAAEVAIHESRVSEAQDAANALKAQLAERRRSGAEETKALKADTVTTQRDTTLPLEKRREKVLAGARRIGEIDGEIEFLRVAHEDAHKRAEQERNALDLVKKRLLSGDASPVFRPLDGQEIARLQAAGFMMNRIGSSARAR